MINCHDIEFYQKLSYSRFKSAKAIFGEKVIKRIIGFSLFLLGAKRNIISNLINIPVNTFKSFIKNLFSTGISTFEDRRIKNKTKKSIEKKVEITIQCGTAMVNLQLKDKIIIPDKNKLQLKTIILTLLTNGIIKSTDAAKILNISISNTYYNAKKLEEKDIFGLLDKRIGQLNDYVVTPEVKAELIQQYAIACITNQGTSGKSLSTQLKNRCNLDLSERTIRYHIKKLGLDKVKFTLPGLLEKLKKT